MLFGALVLLSTVAAADASGTAIVVAIDAKPALQQRMLQIRDWSAATGLTVVDASEAQRRLSGLASPQRVEPAELQKKIDDAADYEARFDNVRALALRREVLQSYDNAITPSTDLQVLAARALHDTAAASLADGDNREALDAARTAQRRFPNVPLDTKRHPPQVAQLFKRATLELKRLPSTEVTFVTTKPGRVMADGMMLDMVTNKATRKLPQGTWVVWMVDDTGTSLAHLVTVASAPVTVDIDFALESALSWWPVPMLRCAPACDTLLRQLASRARVDQAIGVALDTPAHAPALGTFVRADDGTATSRQLTALADLSVPPTVAAVTAEAPRTNFSAWSLVPFGVGQFAQGRYVAGGIYAAVQAGLLAWNIAEASHPAVETSTDETNRRHRQNLAAGLLVGAMVGNIVEAVVVDAMKD